MIEQVSVANVYKCMVYRCQNQKATAYHRYGGRGVRVCDDWLGEDGFRNFVRDMGPRPSYQHSLERKDNNKGYNKENCVWATKKEQARNRSNSFIVEAFGEKKAVAEWAEEFCMSESTLRKRLYNGMAAEEALTQQAAGSQYRFDVERLPKFRDVVLSYRTPCIKVEIPDGLWATIKSGGVPKQVFIREVFGKLWFCSKAYKAANQALPLFETPPGFCVSDMNNWDVIAVFRKRRLWKFVCTVGTHAQ